MQVLQGFFFLQNAFCFWTCFYILYIGKFIRGSAILSAAVDVFWDTPREVMKKNRMAGGDGVYSHETRKHVPLDVRT